MTVKRHIHMADLFEILADTIPDRLALFTNEVEYTFAQLDERVTRPRTTSAQWESSEVTGSRSTQ